MSNKNETACKMLSVALEMERKGKEFYEKSARTCEAEECKKVFEMLASEEAVHMKMIDKIYEDLSSDQPWCEDWQDMESGSDLKEVFAKISERSAGIKADSSDLEAVDAAVKLEESAMEFYKDQLSKAEDPVEKDFLGRMGREEKSHFLALTDMKLYLSDPDAWFREKERGGLDGA